MQLRTQKNSHSNNHKRWGSRGGRFTSKLGPFLEVNEAFAQILEEETKRFLPVIDENETIEFNKEGESA